jgi:hypothetical protein
MPVSRLRNSAGARTQGIEGTCVREAIKDHLQCSVDAIIFKHELNTRSSRSQFEAAVALPPLRG